MKLKITLTPEAREQAIAARIKAGQEVPADFQGPEFTGVSWTTDANYVVVYTDTSTYWYNHSTVARISHKVD